MFSKQLLKKTFESIKKNLKHWRKPASSNDKIIKVQLLIKSITAVKNLLAHVTKKTATYVYLCQNLW